MVELAYFWGFAILVSFSDFSGIRFALSRFQTHETRMNAKASNGAIFVRGLGPGLHMMGLWGASGVIEDSFKEGKLAACVQDMPRWDERPPGWFKRKHRAQ
jgi:hypothetical protein